MKAPFTKINETKIPKLDFKKINSLNSNLNNVSQKINHSSLQQKRGKRRSWRKFLMNFKKSKKLIKLSKLF